MAFRSLLLRRAALPTAAIGAVAVTTFLAPRKTLHAESPPVNLQSAQSHRKPIYDDPLPPKTPSSSRPSSNSPSQSQTSDTQTSPTPTDRLAAQIRRARLFLHAHTALAEDKLNDLLTSFFDLENSFTSTIISLAPAPSTGEKVLPGSLYVLVAAMAGSIVTRNRNILLRGSIPLAVGIVAGWVVLPHTMRNVSDLVWRYEEKVPFVAENHLRVRGAVVQGEKAARELGGEVGNWTESRMREGREALEGWVSKGR